jgi:hypothetical protein
LEAQVGEYQSETPLLFSPASSKQAEDPIWKITKPKKSWGYGSSGRVPA